MTLYEIEQQIYDILMQLEPDPETGQVSGDADSLYERLQELGIEKEHKRDNIAKLILDLRAKVEICDAEEKRLAERKKSLKKKQQTLINLLARCCDGQKTDMGFAVFSTRNTKSVQVTDNNKLICWLLDKGREDLIRYKEPQVDKTSLKKVLAETEVPGAVLVDNVSFSLK